MVTLEVVGARVNIPHSFWNDIDLIYENVSKVTTLKMRVLQCCYHGDILINQVNVIYENVSMVTAMRRHVYFKYSRFHSFVRKFSLQRKFCIREFCKNYKKLKPQIPLQVLGKNLEECKAAKLSRLDWGRTPIAVPGAAKKERASEAWAKEERGKGREGEGLFLRRIMGKFRDLTSPRLRYSRDYFLRPGQIHKYFQASVWGGSIQLGIEVISIELWPLFIWQNLGQIISTSWTQLHHELQRPNDGL